MARFPFPRRALSILHLRKNEGACSVGQNRNLMRAFFYYFPILSCFALPPYLRTAFHQTAPIACRCLANPSASARCCHASVANCQWQFGRFLRTHSLRLSAMTRRRLSNRSHFARQKSQLMKGCPEIRRQCLQRKQLPFAGAASN